MQESIVALRKKKACHAVVQRLNDGSVLARGVLHRTAHTDRFFQQSGEGWSQSGGDSNAEVNTKHFKEPSPKIPFVDRDLSCGRYF